VRDGRVADAYVHAIRVRRYTAVRYGQVATLSLLEQTLGDCGDSEEVEARAEGSLAGY
jgi:hypothetical protein